MGRSPVRGKEVIKTVKLTKEDIRKIIDGIWSRLSPKLAGKADKSHTHPAQADVTGNAGTASKLKTARKIGNASFDGSANITLAQMGAAAASHGTHVTYSTDPPKAAGTAGAGSSAAAARADHVHPQQTDVTGNAGTATKLKTARKIGGVAFDGTGDVNPYEAYLNWGGKDIAGSCGPMDMAINNEFNANRLAYMTPGDILIEYSTDGGSTWKDTGAAAASKTNLVTNTQSFCIGNKSSAAATVNDKLRITLTATSGKLYFSLKKLMINVSTNGAGSCKVTIEGAKIGADTTFVTLKSGVSLSGWSGWNVINQVLTFGGSSSQTSQYRKLRFTFSVGSVSTNASYKSNLTVNAIRAYGENAWNTGGPLAASGHMYTHDGDKNVAFPGKVSATGFNGKATSADKLATARKIGDAAFDGSANITLAQMGAEPLPVVGSITLTKAGWTQDATTKLYKQAKTISGLTAKHRVDLDIDYAVEMDLPAAIRPVNNNGSFYAITAEPPEKDVTAQYTLILTK